MTASTGAATPDRTFRRLLWLTMAVVAIPWIAVLVTSLMAQSEGVDRALTRRVDFIGRQVVLDIQNYLGFGIPFTGLVEAGDYLSSELRGSEVKAAVLATPHGQLVSRYIQPDHANLEFRDFPGEADWHELGLRSLRFPVIHGGQVVGILTLAYAHDTAAGNGTDLLVPVLLLMTILLAAYQVVLVAFREAVWVPLRSVLALEQEAAKGEFAHMAPVPPGGPVTQVVENTNRLVLAINDRFAQVCEFLAELRAFSFNRSAPALTTKLEQALRQMGRFAPDGLLELRLDHGDLFAGPAMFRAGVIIGIVASLAAAKMGGSSAIPLGLATAAVGLPLAAVPTRVSLHARTLGTVSVVALGILSLALVPGITAALCSTMLVSAGAVLAAGSISARDPGAMAARPAHGAAGLAVGGAVAALGSGSLGMTWISYLIAFLALAGLTALTRNYGSVPGSNDARSLVARVKAALPGMPGVGVWAATAYWVIAADSPLHFGQATMMGDSGLALWITALLLALGAAPSVRLLRRADTAAAGLVVAGASASVLLLSLLLSPFTGIGAVLTGPALGAGVAGAATVCARPGACSAALISSGIAIGAVTALIKPMLGDVTLFIPLLLIGLIGAVSGRGSKVGF